MRFYDLSITSAKTGATMLHYSSYPNGAYDPGALNVIFDLPISVQSTALGGCSIRIEGVDPSVLTEAQTYAGQNLTLRGGMGAGLPLANPSQQGVLVGGQIYQAYANWAGTQIDLVLVVLGPKYTMQKPGPFVLNWKAGTPLAPALMNTLRIAYPDYKIQMNIGNIVQTNDEVHPSKTLKGLASLLSDITPTQVQIVINNGVIRVFDSTYKPAPKALAFTDFIGQPVWLQPNLIQARLVLRGDIQIGDVLKMPVGYASLPGFVQTTTASLPSSINYRLAMQGDFRVSAVRHLGDLRQPSGAAWSTLVNMTASPVSQQPRP